MTLKTGLLHEKNATMFRPITAHIISNIKSLYDISLYVKT